MSQSSPKLMLAYSLIELLIVLLLVATLAALAAPGWQSLLIGQRRHEATGALQQLALRQEQFRLQHNRYAGDDELSALPPAGLGIPSAGTHYRLQITLADGLFSATATPLRNSPQYADTECRSFMIDAAGRQTAAAADGSDSSSACWQG